MTHQELKEFLDFKAEHYENTDFIDSDPIQIPHRFSKKEDVEIIALLISTIAWGNRKMIIRSGEKLLEIMENNPYEFIQNYSPKEMAFVHRTFNAGDLDFYFRGLQHIYQNGGLEKAFATHQEYPGVKGRIVNFRQALQQAEHETRNTKHLSNPLKNSACKRINMFLRWMVRDGKKGVDFGIWNQIPTSELLLPLDVHTSTQGRRLGLLTRKQDDWKALEELMAQLRTFDPVDPVKYDFALFGIGAFEDF